MNRKIFGVVMVIAAAVALSAGNVGPAMAQSASPVASPAPQPIPSSQPAAGATLRWVAASGGQVPPGAIIGGMEPARKLFVCRARYGQGGNHPGKIVAGNCNIGWNGREILLPRYEVLTGNAAQVAWIPVIQGKMPGNAYVGGNEAARKLFVCRARFGQGGNVGIHPGKAVDGRCHIGWGGREIVLPSFEVMVAR